MEDERAVGELFDVHLVAPLLANAWTEPFAVELRVDRVGAGRVGMQLLPDLLEPDVVGAAAERAGTVSGRERRRLVEEEQLREAAGLEQRATVPPAEPELAGDPPAAGVMTADAALAVVEAASVAVDEPTGRIRDQLTQRCHPVPQRHGPSR